jgi:hypothetical protein
MAHGCPITFLCLWLLLGGCDDDSAAGAFDLAAEEAITSGEKAMASGIRIKVLADGSVLADDKPVTIEHLDQRFADLAQARGVVDAPDRDKRLAQNRVIFGC